MKKENSFKILFFTAFLKFLRFLIRNLQKVAHYIFRKLNLHRFDECKYETDPKAEKWAKNNNWFGDDRLMTETAFKIHRELVEFEGVNPQSKKYYNEIDKRIYNKFKERLKKYYSMNN